MADFEVEMQNFMLKSLNFKFTNVYWHEHARDKHSTRLSNINTLFENSDINTINSRINTHSLEVF